MWKTKLARPHSQLHGVDTWQQLQQYRNILEFPMFLQFCDVVVNSFLS